MKDKLTIDTSNSDVIEGDVSLGPIGPCIIFGDVFVASLAINDDDECLDDWKEVQTTLGVVGALLLSIIYGRSGLSTEVNEETMWKDHVPALQNLQTIIININFFICLFVTLTAARTVVLLALFPKNRGKPFIRALGSFFVMDIQYICFAPYACFFAIDQMITATLALPRTAGIIVLAFSLAFVALAVAIWIWLDGIGFQSVIGAGRRSKNLSQVEMKMITSPRSMLRPLG